MKGLLRKLKFGLKIPTHKISGVGIIITRNCNLECEYCNVIRSKNKKELSADEWKKIIWKFIKNKHIHFVFTGGEALLYKDIFEVLKFTSKHALVSLISNGKTLNESNLKKLKDIDYLNISIDSISGNEISEKTFNKKTMDLVKKYSKKYGFKVQVTNVITSKNIKEIPDIIKKVSAYGFSTLLSIIHSDKGNYDFRRNKPELEFNTKEDINNLIWLKEKLKHMRKNGYKISESYDFLDDLINYVTGKFKMPCYAGEKYFEINNDGFIKGCHDCNSSNVNGLIFNNYKKMQKNVKETVPKNCNCFYDCYYNTAMAKKKPLTWLKDVIKYRS